MNQGVKMPTQDSDLTCNNIQVSENKDEKKPLRPHHLYIQGNSELLIMLILQHGQGADSQTVNSLVSTVETCHLRPPFGSSNCGR